VQFGERGGEFATGGFHRQLVAAEKGYQLMRMYYSPPQSKTLRVFGGVGKRGSGLEGENP
jgi:hypothetical protein